MRLYHFTWSGWVDDIKKQGILPGDVPVFPSMVDVDYGKRRLPNPDHELDKGMGVSLTGDPSFDSQNWSQGSTVNKTDVRICVEVPDDDPRLIRWVDICRAAIKEYGDRKFPVPREVERDESGRMLREESGDPVVKQYAEGEVTLRHWYGILNSMGSYREWFVWNGTVPPEWIQSVAARDEAVVAETPALTPAGAIAYVESLTSSCLTIPEKIAEASTKPDGDTWSGNGIRSMATLIKGADLFLWKADLFRAAGRGAEVFDGTPFGIEMPRDGVIFVPDRRMTAQAHRKDPEARQLATFDALLMYSIEKQKGRFYSSHSGKDYSWNPADKGRGDLREGHRSRAKEAPDGKYVAAVLIKQTGGAKPVMEADFLETMADVADNKLAEWDPDSNLEVRALPMMGLGQACEGWGSLIQALFQFMDQKIVSTELYGPPRSERRRLKKARLPIWDVKVIQLRRYQQGQGQGPGAGTVDWQCQWTVSGHWRKQPYPAKGTTEVIWIEPYIKGPEDKPLRDPTKSIFSVRR